MVIRLLYLFAVFFLAAVWGCHPADTSPLAPADDRAALLARRLQQLRETAKTGDLVLRLSDDIISQQVSNMNTTDKAFSHCGVVVQMASGPYVYHIEPALSQLADTIRLEPLDTFLNPAKNIRCGLQRYRLSAAESHLLIKTLEHYKGQPIRFDPVYDYATNHKMYCSEMVSKALTTATANRMQFELTPVPERMRKRLLVYLKKQHLTKEIVATRKVITLDNLYLRPDCQELMRFDLKIFPGQ